MNILIIGNGGREHAIALSLSKSPKVGKVYLSGPNGGAKDKILSIDLSSDFNEIDKFIKDFSIDFTVIGPENPLNEGIVDFLEERGHLVFGPRKSSALLEGSKGFAKKFMDKYKIPTAEYKEFFNYESALASIDKFGFPLVIKADGLCAGKGVYICENDEEARDSLKEIFLDKIFEDQGNKVVFEKFLNGFEASLLCFVSKDKIYPFDTAMDYKKIYEDDLGPNTGGVGCLSPNPYWNEDLNRQSNEILTKIEKGLKDEKLAYSGILFIGYIVENGKLYVLEFNTRFGDPETEVLLARLKSDLLENMLEAVRGQAVKLSFEDNYALALILVSEGYPKKYEKAFPIDGIDRIDKDLYLYHNGTRNLNGEILTNGGRVLTIVGVDRTLEKARKKVYLNADRINFSNKFYRKDIGRIK